MGSGEPELSAGELRAAFRSKTSGARVDVVAGNVDAGRVAGVVVEGARVGGLDSVVTAADGMVVELDCADTVAGGGATVVVGAAIPADGRMPGFA